MYDMKHRHIGELFMTITASDVQNITEKMYKKDREYISLMKEGRKKLIEIMTLYENRGYNSSYYNGERIGKFDNFELALKYMRTNVSLFGTDGVILKNNKRIESIRYHSYATFIDGELHSWDGKPSNILAGKMEWRQNGRYHRHIAPAHYYTSNVGAWYINGNAIEPVEYLNWIDSMGIDVNNITLEDEIIINLAYGS